MIILKSIFYGIFSAIGATIFQTVVVIILGVKTIDTNHLTSILIYFALLEELFKFIFIYKLGTETQNFKEIISGSLLIGLGFSLVELTFKTLENSENLLYLDYLGIILIHVLTAGIIGIFIAQKWNTYIKIILGIGTAFILHIIYNSLQIYIF